MELPQLLHSTRSYGRANSAFSWKLLVLEQGISLLPTEVAVRPIGEGRLVRILPGWCSEEVTLHLVFTTRRGLAPAVRVFIDYLADHFVYGGQRPARLLS